MENTQSVQFADDQPEWFISVGEKYRGPFKPSEVYQKLLNKEISWIDYCYREKDAKSNGGQWVRIADHEVFKSLQPEPPRPKPPAPPAALTPPPPPKAEPETKWFLFQNDVQTGPYAAQELKRMIANGQVPASAFVWQENFSEWKPVDSVAELKAAAPGAPPPARVAAPATPAEKRSAPRKPLVAQIYATNHAQVVSGICRDISIGGMQVLTDQNPGAVGTTIRLNVAPPKDSGLKPFVAEGVVVRILEDQRGFSFRFSQISDEAKQSIQGYIGSP